jgi:hypothetical protein
MFDLKKIPLGSNRGRLKELFLTISFFYSVCGPRKAMHSDGANSKIFQFFPFSFTNISRTVGDRNPVFAPLNPPRNFEQE